LNRSPPAFEIVNQAPIRSKHSSPAEVPLSIIDIENMLRVAGGIVLPPVPAFHNRSSSVEETIDHIVNWSRSEPIGQKNGQNLGKAGLHVGGPGGI